LVLLLSFSNKTSTVRLQFLFQTYEKLTLLHYVSSEYIPYVFQVLSQMLELHRGGQVPDAYRSLLPFLLTPAMWQQKGSIPGLVRLLKAFLSLDSAQMFAAGQVASVLAVVQQRLIPSKANDEWGFNLLQSVITNVNPCVLVTFSICFVVVVDLCFILGLTCNNI